MIKKAFTLVELVISIAISSIVLVFLFSIVANVILDIQGSIHYSKVLTELNEFTQKMNNYKSFYLSGSLLVDNTSGIGSDVLLFTDLEAQHGVIFWIVEGNSLRLSTPIKHNYSTQRHMGYREVSAWEIAQIQADPSSVYNFKFFADKVQTQTIVKDFQTIFFNWWNVLQVNFEMNTGWINGQEVQKYSDISPNNIDKYNFNF